MSTAESQSPSSSAATDRMVKDVFLWRKKKLSSSVLVGATLTWGVLEVYQFNFLTVASWAAMAVVALLFIWGNLCRLLGKPPPSFSDTEISEKTALNTAITLKRWIERGIRWLLHVGAGSEWYEFARVFAALWVLSMVGSGFDFLTILYIGVVVGLTVPVIYVKYEDKIRSWRDGIMMGGRRLYEKLDEKVVRKVKDKKEE